MTALFLCTSVLGWSLWIYQRRVARRRYGQLICDHRHALTQASMRGKLAGAKAAELAQQTRMGRGWQEAAR